MLRRDSPLKKSVLAATLQFLGTDGSCVANGDAGVTGRVYSTRIGYDTTHNSS